MRDIEVFFLEESSEWFAQDLKAALLIFLSSVSLAFLHIIYLYNSRK